MNNDAAKVNSTEIFTPVVNSKEVEWAVELDDVSWEENVVANREAMSLVNIPGTQQSSSGQTNSDDDVLSGV